LPQVVFKTGAHLQMTLCFTRNNRNIGELEWIEPYGLDRRQAYRWKPVVI